MYFNEAHDTAKAAVGEALGKFQDLLAALDKPEADKLQRSMGMKMQQLKARAQPVQHASSLALAICAVCNGILSRTYAAAAAVTLKPMRVFQMMGCAVQAELMELDELHA